MEILFKIFFAIVFILVLATIVISVVTNIKKNGGKISSVFNQNDEIVEMVKKNLDKQQNPEKYAKHCEYCGAVLKDDATKCDSCGAQITKKEE